MRTLGYLAFLAGLGLTGWTCQLVHHAQERQIRASFERDAAKVGSDTAVRLQTYFDMLLSMKGMFTLSDQIDRAQFARFVKALNLAERYPGFQAIQFVRYVPAGELEQFAARVHGDRSLVAIGYPGFAIHPQAARQDHYIIDYNEPMRGNENAFGLDLGALAPHLRAIEAGRDSDLVVATERITLVQDARGEAGFVARAPVYRNGMPTDTVAQRRAAFVGLVAIVFRVGNLMNEVIDPGLRGQLALRIHDGGTLAYGSEPPADKNNTMYDSGNGALRLLPGLEATSRIQLGQRHWVVKFGALEGSRYSSDLVPIVQIGASGIVISALLAAVLLSLARSHTLAERLRVALEEQRAFQDSASVGLVLVAGGTIVRCNRGMEDVMGYWPGELSGRPTAKLAQGADPFVAARSGRRWQGELELLRKDGTLIACLVSGKALATSELAESGVWVVQDISDRKTAEAELVDARDGLEHSLAELEKQKASVELAHKDLSSVLQTLKQAQTNLITSEKMASLGSLVAGIAHELNTPIGNSLLTATALQDMVADFEQHYASGGIKRSALETHLADTRMACTIMTSSLRRAADLITSFKQVAVDQTSDKRRRFDLAEVVHDTLATYAAQLRRANCETEVDVGPALILDSYPGSVSQVLTNLINNTVLHGFEGCASGRITITARQLEAEQVLLTFADDGVGMSSKVLHQVFDPFFTTKMGQGGSGLGMNIVYNLVTGMLGGQIALASEPGKGTSVTITMPMTAPRRSDEDADLSALQAR